MRPSPLPLSLLRRQAGPRPTQWQRILLDSATLTARRYSLGQSRTLFTRKTPAQKLKNRLWTLTGLVAGGLFAVYAYDSSAGVHRWLVIPLLHAFTKNDPEKSHEIAIKVLASGVAPVDTTPDQEDILGFELFGRHFSNPVGLAAGFDKHGEAIDALFNLGFSYVEIGSITPQPQDGNPQPRLFRLPSTQSVINRYGFNSEGHVVVLARLRERIHTFLVNNALLLPSDTFPEAKVSALPDPDPIDAILTGRTDADVIDGLALPRSLKDGRVLAINLGKNKASLPDSVQDYVEGVERLGPYADVLVVNVSSPNTPGLRSLQNKDALQKLLTEVVNARNGLTFAKKPAVLVKIAPDLTRQEVADIAAAATATKIDGIIVSNTTISRPDSAGNDPALKESGGLSGPPLKPLSLRTLKYLYALTSGSIPLIGCGGISTGQDALDYARAGASFVQFYTALGYQGVGLPRMIKNEIVDTLKAENKTWKDIVGSGIDLASIQALGRDSNPAALLGLEEDAKDGLQQLREQIESAIYGKAQQAKTVIAQPSLATQSVPDWDESPAQSSKATIPSATATATVDAESGYVPAGYPQIIIEDRVPAYTPARQWTAKDVREKVKEAKSIASDVQDKLEIAAHEVKEAAAKTADNFKALGQAARDDPLVDVIKEAGKQTGENFSALAHEVRHDPLAHEVKETTKAAAVDAGRNFQQLGQDIKNDAFAREIADTTRTSAKEAGQAFRRVGEDIANDPLPREVADVTKASARDAGQAFRRVGDDIANDPFPHQAKEATMAAARDGADVTAAAARQTYENFKAIGKDISDDDFAAQIKNVTVAAARDAVRNFKKIFKDISDDQFYDEADRVTRDAIHQTAANFRKLGRDIRDDDFAREAAETAKNAAAESAGKFRKLGKDIKDDDFLEQVKDTFSKAAAEAARNFALLGREIRDDPLYDQARELGKNITSRTTGSSGQPIRREGVDAPGTGGGGIWSLGSSIGMRSEVSREGKRIV